MTTSVAAIAALYVLLTFNLAGNILTTPAAPSILSAYSNDDGVIDSGLDPGDTGSDPYSAFISDAPGAGHADRTGFDLQICTVVITGGGSGLDIQMSNAYEGTLGPSYCSVMMDLENLTGQDLELSDVVLVGAPIEVSIFGGCGTLLPDGTSTTVVVDLNVEPAAPGGAFTGGTIDLTWNYPGTFTCP